MKKKVFQSVKTEINSLEIFISAIKKSNFFNPEILKKETGFQQQIWFS